MYQSVIRDEDDLTCSLIQSDSAITENESYVNQDNLEHDIYFVVWRNCKIFEWVFLIVYFQKYGLNKRWHTIFSGFLFVFLAVFIFLWTIFLCHYDKECRNLSLSWWLDRDCGSSSSNMKKSLSKWDHKPGQLKSYNSLLQ